MRKYKATGCARFFIVLIILAPLAYVGASLYNGQNPVDNIKELLGMNDADSSADDNALILDEQNSTEPARTPPPVESTNDEEVSDLTKQNTDLTEENSSLTEENSDLKEEVGQLKERIKGLEEEIEKLKAAIDTTGN